MLALEWSANRGLWEFLDTEAAGGLTTHPASHGVLVVPLGPRYFTLLTDLGVAGDIGIHIDRTFGLDEVPDALRYVGEGLAHGKVVVTTD
jgi:hypothetical protein